MRFLKIASSNVPNYGWPIVVCCYTITLLAIPLASLPCSYSNPSIDEIQFVDLAGNDHHDNVKRSLDTKADHTHPLKIHLHYDIASIGKLDVEKQIYINSTLLPAATEFWEQALYVRQKRFPIRLPRKCITNGYYVKRNDTIPICFKDCQKVNFCGAVEVPKDHLLKCYYCTAKSNNSCDNTSYEDGEGVEGADFILYVSAARTDKCKGVDTIAYAAHCAQEAELDRPIAGHVNICPDALSTHSHDQEILLSTVKHEILHALGFSAGLYAFWRDDSGKPRTKRNRHGKPLSLNREKGYYDWDDSTIKTITRNDWWTAEGITSHTIHVMVTERVKSEVQAHFGCNSLEGAELENQGGDGTAITHWEKRVFENEAMTGTHTQDPVYSRITLALLEDTGWYKANYEAAEDLHWGYQLGCNFTKQSCGQWISEKMANRESVAPFCVDIKHDGKKNLAVTRCTAQRDSLALCNLVPYTKEIPLEYRNFQHLNGLRANALKYYGGSVELSDFCPYNQEFEWKDKFNAEGNKIRRDSRLVKNNH
uniref:Leishmanolysin-like peptidase n=1 Tax=Rhabditophanes sp. KR3021 TaxID=114890 RepID=A0AC35TRY7_9BILA